MAEDQTGVKTKSKKSTKLDKPRMYKVILHNDDYTSMDFVVAILESVFNKGPAEAVQIMLQVHNLGYGLCGIYPREIAEAKVDLVHARAKEAAFPLKASMQEN